MGMIKYWFVVFVSSSLLVRPHTFLNVKKKGVRVRTSAPTYIMHFSYQLS